MVSFVSISPLEEGFDVGQEEGEEYKELDDTGREETVE